MPWNQKQCTCTWKIYESFSSRNKWKLGIPVKDLVIKFSLSLFYLEIRPILCPVQVGIGYTEGKKWHISKNIVPPTQLMRNIVLMKNLKKILKSVKNCDAPWRFSDRKLRIFIKSDKILFFFKKIMIFITLSDIKGVMIIHYHKLWCNKFIQCHRALIKHHFCIFWRFFGCSRHTLLEE